MGTNHSPRHDSRNGNDSEEDNVEQYENDGWRVGFEVEMNGVGHEHQREPSDDGGESSGWESDLPSDDEERSHRVNGEGNGDDYAGYQAIPDVAPVSLEPTEPGSSEELEPNWTANFDYNPDPSTVQAKVMSEFDKLLSSSPLAAEKLPIEHNPRPIDLNDEKIATIRSTMGTFSLPPPPQWADSEIKDADLSTLLDRLKNSQL